MNNSKADLHRVWRVFMTSLIDNNNSLLKRLSDCYINKNPSSIAVVDNPQHAEVILFAETGYFGWLNIASLLKYCRKFNDKHVIMLNNTDWPYPVAGGFYPSLTKASKNAFSWAYFLTSSAERAVDACEPRYLYSFVGRACTHKTRKQILTLDCIDNPCIDVDNLPSRFREFDYDITYNEIINDSLFVLCPRGFGASSIRLFETMRAGRVPVIISDDWIPPPIENWDSFSLRVPEKYICDIPEILKRNKCQADLFGKRAKDTFHKYFHEDVFLYRLIDFYLQYSEPLSRADYFWRALRNSGVREIRSMLRR
jgi:hypothetical protein